MWPRFIPACAGNSRTTRRCPGTVPVHPRVCGELRGGTGAQATDYGSSPRVRGTHEPAGEHGYRRRFIPACAGNSPSWPPAPAPGSVHPRVCGELIPLFIGPRHTTGSSPRVRGTRRQEGGEAPALQVHPRVCGELLKLTFCIERTFRFIPACAGNSRQPYSPTSVSPVHPRVCGELPISRIGNSTPSGSSPRVRGTRRRTPRPRETERFIPACAGNSPDQGVRYRDSAVHPRVCGELVTVGTDASDQDGSSPRVRGTRKSHLTSRTFPAVHPRVCGELDFVLAAGGLVDGSSPRVRGTPAAHRHAVRQERFIPACAGNSVDGRRRDVPLMVHPRVCGELFAVAAVSLGKDGSSPRVRGTRVRPRRPVGSERFIPACAGNSRSPPDAPSEVPVHPRVCGELRISDSPMARAIGSSPRVRGTRAVRLLALGGRRFIPACAGNSWTWQGCSAASAVHPRVCGELPSVSLSARRASGSSPRVRGTPFRHGKPSIGQRFIPACAGNSEKRWPTRSTRPVHPRVCGELFLRVL